MFNVLWAELSANNLTCHLVVQRVLNKCNVRDVEYNALLAIVAIYVFDWCGTES